MVLGQGEAYSLGAGWGLKSCMHLVPLGIQEHDRVEPLSLQEHVIVRTIGFQEHGRVGPIDLQEHEECQ